jgi:protein phosphatase
LIRSTATIPRTLASTAQGQALAWSTAAASHAGSVRENNEDCFLEAPDRGLWGVADGMGGLAAGDVASRNIINALDRFEPSGDLASDVDWLEDSLSSVNRLLRQRHEWVRSKHMGSTVALLLAHQRIAIIMWAGDSRIYRYRRGSLRLLTEDHSYVEELIRHGKVRREEANTHPAANIISRAVGVEDTLFVDLDYTQVDDGDVYLICTDGLFRELSDAQIEGCLETGSLEEARDRLLQGALDAGAKDNVTLIVTKASASRDDIEGTGGREP